MPGCGRHGGLRREFQFLGARWSHVEARSQLLSVAVFIAAVAAVEFGIHVAFSNAMIGIFLEFLVGLVAFGIALVVGIGVGGPVSTAIREYALLFYGSRYQPLGDILFPPPPNVGLNAPGIA